jgi:hypothetical protein
MSTKKRTPSQRPESQKQPGKRPGQSGQRSGRKAKDGTDGVGDGDKKVEEQRQSRYVWKCGSTRSETSRLFMGK